MGMIFGFSCDYCGNKECSCTQEELKTYNEKRTNTISEPIYYSSSKPIVCTGDIILQSDVEYLVTVLKDGSATKTSLSPYNTSITELKGKYSLVKIIKYD